MADKFRDKIKSVKFRPHGIPYDKPISRERLGYGPIIVMNVCMMDGCGQAFESDKKELICPRCKAVVAALEEATEDVPTGNLPPGVGRLGKALIPNNA